jgi:cyclin B
VRPGGSVSVSAYPGARGALGDITNITASRASHADKLKPYKSSYAPPAVVVASDPVETTTDVLHEEICTKEKGAEERVSSESTNIQNVQEYAPEICNRFFEEEICFLPRADYMDTQSDITSKMRTILIDWLVEVHTKYNLRTETLHLTINLVDRYLSKQNVMRKRLQLIGVVAMFIASKFEEINPPELQDWVYITDNAYTKDDMLITECAMLNALSFNIMVPTAANFFDLLEKANGCDEKHRWVAQYLLELGLLDTRMVQYKPSHVVSAALLLSNELVRRSTVWPAAMVEESRLSEQTLQPCVAELRQLLEADRAGAGGQLQAVHKKFSSAQRGGVAKMQF